MNLKFNCYLPLVLCLIFLAGCSKSDDQQKFEDRSLVNPDGITKTDGNGDILDGKIDNDDWRVGPMYAQLIEISSEIVEPPYPNPLPYNSRLTINIKFNVPDPVNAIVIRKFDTVGERNYPRIASRSDEQLNRFNNIEILGKRIAEGPGSSGNGPYRILIYDRRQNLISYGDVRIK